MPRQNLIQLRRGTAAQWADVDPILATGEPGYETDTARQRVGDGTKPWSALPYLVDSRAIDVDDTDTWLDVTRRRRYTNPVGAKGSFLRIEQHADGSGGSQVYGIDIAQNPGAVSAFVGHQYSSARAFIELDNTDSQPLILMRNTNNPVKNPGGAAAGQSATGDFLRFVNTSGYQMFRVLGRGEVIIRPAADTTAHALEVVGATDSSRRLFKGTMNGPGTAVEIVASTASAGFWPLLVTGHDYGPRFSTSQNGANRFVLQLVKSGTGNGNVLAMQNHGTDKTVRIQQGTTDVAAINADGEFEHLTAGKGMILKSPDGTRYRVAVADGGTVTVDPA